eukprot:403353653
MNASQNDKKEELKQDIANSDDEDIDDYLEPTEKPEVGVQQNKVEYVTQVQNNDEKEGNQTSTTTTTTQLEEDSSQGNSSGKAQQSGSYITHVQDYDQLNGKTDKRCPVYVESDKKILLTDILNKYRNQYDNNFDEIIKRATRQQTVKDITVANIEGLQKAENIMSYLQNHSELYKNVIGVSELARGGEAVVYRMDHQNLDEVVAKCTLIKDKNNVSNQIFMDILTESQQLKLLSNPMYIAQVKEEIINYDFQNKQVTQYVAIVERAQNSLDDLLKIWNDQLKSKDYVEYYHPHKLTYYFYQILSIVEFLNQRDFYYGDMKPQNLLVFRDQLVKVGDLGISIKTQPNIPNDMKHYRLKGLSTAYQRMETMQAFQLRKKLSFNELVEADRYSTLRTLEKCIDKVKAIHENNFQGQPQLYKQMFQDLEKSSIKEVLEKWSRFFQENFKFVQELANLMKREGKTDSLQYIYGLSQHQHLMQNELLPIYKQFQEDNGVQTHFSKIDEKYDKINLETSKHQEIQSQFREQPMSEQNNQTLNQNNNFKIVIIDLINSWNVETSTKNTKSIINYDKLKTTYNTFFQVEGSDLDLIGNLIQSNDKSEQVVVRIELLLDNLFSYQKWSKLMNPNQEPIWTQLLEKFKFIDKMRLNTKPQLDSIERKLLFINTLTKVQLTLIKGPFNQLVRQLTRLLRDIQYNQNKSLMRMMIDDLYIRLQQNQEQKEDNYYEFKIFEKMAQEIIQEIEIKRKIVIHQEDDDVQIRPIFQLKELILDYYMTMQKGHGFIVQRKCQNTLKEWKNYLGDSHPYIMELYGIIAKSYCQMNDKLSEEQKETRNSYFYKFSYQSREAALEYIEFCKECGLKQEIIDAIKRFNYSTDLQVNNLWKEILSVNYTMVSQIDRNETIQQLNSLLKNNEETPQDLQNFNIFKNIYQFIKNDSEGQSFTRGDFEKLGKDKLMEILDKELSKIT